MLYEYVALPFAQLTFWLQKDIPNRSLACFSRINDSINIRKSSQTRTAILFVTLCLAFSPRLSKTALNYRFCVLFADLKLILTNLKRFVRALFCWTHTLWCDCLSSPIWVLHLFMLFLSDPRIRHCLSLLVFSANTS